MSDYDYDDDNTENSPKALRDHAEKLKKQLADALKANEALQSQVTDLSGQVKKSSLADLLKQAGIDPKFASRADKDGAEASAEGVKKWVDENRDFYNFGTQKREQKAANEDEPAGEPNVSEETEAAIRASQGLDASGVSPSEVDVMQKLQSIDVSKFNSPEELQAAIAATGIQFD